MSKQTPWVTKCWLYNHRKIKHNNIIWPFQRMYYAGLFGNRCAFQWRRMRFMVSQITSNLTTFYNLFWITTRKYTKALHYWPVVRGFHWLLVVSPHRGPVVMGWKKWKWKLKKSWEQITKAFWNEYDTSCCICNTLYSVEWRSYAIMRVNLSTYHKKVHWHSLSGNFTKAWKYLSKIQFKLLWACELFTAFASFESYGISRYSTQSYGDNHLHHIHRLYNVSTIYLYNSIANNETHQVIYFSVIFKQITWTDVQTSCHDTRMWHAQVYLVQRIIL